jgi:hypothetical protein
VRPRQGRSLSSLSRIAATTVGSPCEGGGRSSVGYGGDALARSRPSAQFRRHGRGPRACHARSTRHSGASDHAGLDPRSDPSPSSAVSLSIAALFGTPRRYRRLIRPHRCISSSYGDRRRATYDGRALRHSLRSQEELSPVLARACSNCGALLAHSATCVAAGASTSAVSSHPNRCANRNPFHRAAVRPVPFLPIAESEHEVETLYTSRFFSSPRALTLTPVISLSNRLLSLTTRSLSSNA